MLQCVTCVFIFQTSTIGLVTLDEMKAKQEVIVQEREKQLAKKLKEKEKEIERELEAKKAEKAKQKKQIQTLSFQLDEEEGEHSDSETVKPSNVIKPTKETSNDGKIIHQILLLLCFIY